MHHRRRELHCGIHGDRPRKLEFRIRRSIDQETDLDAIAGRTSGGSEAAASIGEIRGARDRAELEEARRAVEE
ncbi:hypothetical protein E2562_015685 [Oryza meyeriana var. granulata]|uniref:Uncharacterized protein n=1 Tax=Oryza meyeriana var. granulata TaxID=110450 RepID=A0A6G1D420_9ORYZ|nr:hypothetical protein E2562_015685 [Oryza meyeriana var. granulata]